MQIKIKYVLPVLIPLIVLFIPSSFFPFESITIMQQRTIALFLFAALCWVLEPIPIYATSVCVIVLELLFMSDKGMIWFRQAAGSHDFGSLLSYKEIMGTFSSPIIMLFLGGFFLAMAATKYRLDVNLAKVLLKPFGKKTSHVLAGLMFITAIFSMFMSNTATTAMMLAILAPILVHFKPQDPGRIAFALCIPVAANIGGIGTPIGTPPNAIALKYLTGENAISFGEWMSFAIPFVILMLFVAWYLLSKFFPADENQIEVKINGSFLKTPKAILVYVTFTLTIILWLMGSTHGMNSYTVAMIPVAIFSLTGIINKDDLKRISWDVLWLVSGGFALGLGLEKTGLAQLIVTSIPFEMFKAEIVLVGAALLCLVMANFMSHTATANLLMPMMAALGASMTSLDGVGGEVALILVVTFAASLGMSLPISTPPNALAHATGFVDSRQMARVGVLVGAIGLLFTFIMVWLLKIVEFI